VWLLNKSGRRLRPLVDSLDYFRPQWTADGTHIVAMRYGLGHAIGQWTDDGATHTTIPLIGFEAQYRELMVIAMSRSGKRAAIVVDHFETMLLVDTGPERWTVTRIVPDGFAYVSGPAWIDDQHLIFTGGKPGQQDKGLWTLDTQTGVVTPLPAGALSIRDFVTLAPDATAVVVCAYGGGELKWSLWRVDLVSGATRRLTSGIEDVTPSWGSRSR
jgi:hypothetical protein